MEVLCFLLRHSFHSFICLLLHPNLIARENLWRGSSKSDLVPDGNASNFGQLWCWVADEWDYLRLALFYGPVWLVLVVTLAIYIAAGKQIFEKRRQLRSFAGHASNEMATTLPEPFANPFGTKTTEISVSTELADMSERPSERNSMDANGKLRKGNIYNDYSVTIEGSKPPVLAPPVSPGPRKLSTRGGPVDLNQWQRRAAMESNNAAWSYTKCAMLFFVAILVTWVSRAPSFPQTYAYKQLQVPSTINRVYQIARPESTSFPLLFVSALVLPLQGFWNALVYATTSWKACQELLNDMPCLPCLSRSRGLPTSHAAPRVVMNQVPSNTTPSVRKPWSSSRTNSERDSDIDTSSLSESTKGLRGNGV